VTDNCRISTSRYWAVVSAVLLAALLLRVAGIGWGLPTASHPSYSYHPDEVYHLIWAHWLAQGRIVPQQFMYGGTLHSGILNAYHYYGALLGSQVGGTGDLARTILFGRYCVVAFSLLSIVLLAETGRRLFGPTVGLLAAAFLALSPAHTFLAQNIRPDELATLFAALLTFLSVLILQTSATRDRRYLVLAGLALGAAVALRFPLAAFGVAPLAALVLREQPRSPRAVVTTLLGGRTLLLLSVAAAGYLVASPESVTHARSFVDGLLVQWRYQSGVFEDAAGRGPRVYQYGWLMLREALGLPLCLLALGGVVLALCQRTRAQLLLLVVVAPYFVLLTFTAWVVVRYALPIAPVLSLLAAVLVTAGRARCPKRYRYVSVAVACVTIVWTLMADVAFLRVEASKNVRDQAAEWMAGHVTPGTLVVSLRQYLGDVFFNPGVPAGCVSAALLLTPNLSALEIAGDKRCEYLVVNETVYGNMDRLGANHPRLEVRGLGDMLGSGRYYRLVTRFKPPVVLWGLDFSGSFTSQDFVIINPGIRIYRRIATL
jgi:4-amino-4-deoxy-L-arabinose transferase-like glycosyltransferase